MSDSSQVWFDDSKYTANTTQTRHGGQLLSQLKRVISKDDKSHLFAKRVIDVGSNDGELTEIVNNTFQNAMNVAADESFKHVKKCPEQISPVCASFPKHPFRNQSFDIVFSNATVHWIMQQEKLYKEFMNITRNHGYIAICTGAAQYNKEFVGLARELSKTEKYSSHFSDGFEYPLQYYTENEYREFMQSIPNLKIREFHIEEKIGSAESYPRFIDGGILPFLKQLPTEKHSEFKTDFETECRANLSDVTMNRIFTILKKKL